MPCFSRQFVRQSNYDNVLMPRFSHKLCRITATIDGCTVLVHTMHLEERLCDVYAGSCL
jgi:hypothetical protein